MLKRLLVVIITIFALNTIAFATDLNAPAVKDEEPPSIKSELERARTDANNLSSTALKIAEELRALSPEEKDSLFVIMVKASREEMEKVIFLNKKNNTCTVAYLLGLNAGLWEKGIRALKTDAIKSDTLINHFSEFRKRQKQLEINDKDLFTIFVNDKCLERDIIPALSAWKSKFEK